MAALPGINTGLILHEMSMHAMKQGIEGVGVLSGCEVTQSSGGADEKVDIAAGYLVAGDGELKTIAGGNYGSFGNVHATLDRVDLVIWDDSAGDFAIVAGTASANLNCPDPGDLVNDLPIAFVYITHDVGEGAPDVTDSDIFNVTQLLLGNQVVHTASDWAWNNSADIYLYSDYGSTQKIKLDGGTGDVTIAGDLAVQGNNINDSGGTGITFDGSGNISIGTGELTCGSINRASGTLTLEIGGTPEISTTTGLTTFAGDIQISGNDIKASDAATNITLTSSTLTTFAGDIKIIGNDILDSGGSLMISFDGSGTIDGLTNISIAPLFSAGLYIGSSVSTDYLFDDASTGGGTKTMYIGNAFINVTSDKRLKENITPTTYNALKKINQLKVVDFTWNDPSDRAEVNRNSRGIWTGLIAQEVIDIVPYVINAPDRECKVCRAGIKCDEHPNYWFIDYDCMVPLLCKAIQELKKEIDLLKN